MVSVANDACANWLWSGCFCLTVVGKGVYTSLMSSTYQMIAL